MEPQKIGLDQTGGKISGATAAAYAEQLFGGITKCVSTLVPVTTGQVQLLANNPRRIFWYVQNVAVNNMYVMRPDDLANNIGVLLGANGGWVSMRLQYDGEAVTEAIWGTNLVATGNAYVMETFTV
jgi:hypothetical protein